MLERAGVSGVLREQLQALLHARDIEIGRQQDLQVGSIQSGDRRGHRWAGFCVLRQAVRLLVLEKMQQI